MFSVLEDGVGDVAAAQHARQLRGAFSLFKVFDARDGAASLLDLLDAIVVVREAGDLREVRDAEHLARLSQLAQLATHRFGGAPAGSRVDCAFSTMLTLTEDTSSLQNYSQVSFPSDCLR